MTGWNGFDSRRPMSLKQMMVGGVEIAYLDRGNGPPVIIAHCSSASHREWLPLIEAPQWAAAHAEQPPPRRAVDVLRELLEWLARTG